MIKRIIPSNLNLNDDQKPQWAVVSEPSRQIQLHFASKSYKQCQNTSTRLSYASRINIGWPDVFWLSSSWELCPLRKFCLCPSQGNIILFCSSRGNIILFFPFLGNLVLLKNFVLRPRRNIILLKGKLSFFFSPQEKIILFYAVFNTIDLII